MEVIETNNLVTISTYLSISTSQLLRVLKRHACTRGDKGYKQCRHSRPARARLHSVAELTSLATIHTSIQTLDLAGLAGESAERVKTKVMSWTKIDGLITKGHDHEKLRAIVLPNGPLMLF